jgi:ligand-binding sensor domain-containing protein/signal transduction histidine kinase
MLKYLLILLILVISDCLSQSSSYDIQGINFRFENLSIELGLSQSSIMDIIQDKRGFLWIATQDGLNRFDGYNFLVFKNEIDDSNSLSHNYIYSLAEDKEGNIWIATALGGICKYNPGTNLFRRYLRDNQNRKISSALSVYVDSKNQVWAGTYLVGLSKYDPGSDKFISFVPEPETAGTIPTNTIFEIFEDKEGNIWLGSADAGLILFDRNKSEFISFSEKDGLASNYITSICEDINGNLVIGTTNGLSIFDKRGTFKNYSGNSNDPFSLSSNKIREVLVDNSGSIFIGTEDKGINYFNSVENKLFTFKTEDKMVNGISDNNILSLYRDRSGIMWVGTSKGLNKINNRKNFYILLGPDPKNRGESIWSIIEDKNHNIWIGTEKGFTKIENPERGSDKNRTKVNKITGSTLTGNIEDKIICALTTDKDGNIWAGSNSGLSCLDTKTNSLTTYINNRGNESFYYNLYKSIYLDGNIIWLGTYARGITKFDINTKSFQSFESAKGNDTLLNKFNVFQIYKDHKAHFWFCTSVGLYEYNSDSDEIILHISTFDDITGDATKIYNQCLCISEADDCFWVGTSGGGLVKFIPGKGIIERFTEQQGLSNNVVYGILIDDEGKLWLSTNSGLSKFNPNEKKFRNYFVSDGLPSNEFNVGAFYKSSSGKFYFGSINGLISFYPNEIKNSTYLPQTQITALNISGLPYGKKLFFSNEETIELSYQENFFSFEFSSLDFTSPEENQYAFKLEGFDKNWNYIGNIHYASYTNIDPGEYIFKVKGTNSDGIWNEQGASLRIIISPPFYKTWWAYIFYAIAFVISLYSIRKYELNKRKRKTEAILKEEKEKAKLREVQLRAEKAELQAKAIESEKEIEKQNIRYRIATDLHDEIGSNLSSIKLLSSILTSEISKNKTGSAQNVNILSKLSEINFAASSSAEAIRDIVWFINPMSDGLNNLILKMKKTAGVMLGNVSVEISTSGFSDDEKINPDIKRNIYLIYKEILNNVVRHSKAGMVKIFIIKSASTISMSIQDDGIGFDLSEETSGNGLRNIRQRAEQINGVLDINSIKGKGTSINLRVEL